MTKRQELEVILERHKGLEGPLLPILHAVQGHFGYVPPELEADVAVALNLSAAEVRGVISFYHDFRSEPAGEHQVKICCAEACQARGSRSLADHAQASLGVEFGDTTANGRVTLEKVYCLGNCACGPSVSVDGEVYARVDGKGFDQLIAELGEAR